MPITPSSDYVERCFAAIERAANAGQRCPENGTFDVTSTAVKVLALAGRIKVEISGNNYRTIKILTGDSAGKSTAPDPRGRRPWKVIDRNGTRRADGFPLPLPPGRRQPSAPRPLNKVGM